MVAFYLAWRITIINDNSLLLSLTYYLAECCGFILGLSIIFSSWKYRHREPPPAPAGLKVDVFVLTYKEPIDIIRQTVLAASRIDYPHATLVLDDGNRPEVRELAESLGLRYLARGHNQDAKAGNLNFGLQHSNADFVAVFDADHIAQPHALDVMLGFFADERVAMVQTPQDYYNIDAFQYMNPGNRAGLWHDQSFFYNIEQPCHDTHNAASCVGTCVVYRRSALDDIKGIPADTITEDFHTSLKLHKRGHRTLYVNEPVAYGVAAADLDEYYKTRHRWAHGNLTALMKENILTCKGLSLMQRLSYLSLGIIYLEGWQQLMLFVVPVLSLVFGLAPFEITIFNVLIVLTFPILTYILLQELGCGFTRYWTNEIFAMARWPIHLISAAALFGVKLSWKTSAKNIKGRINWLLMLPQSTVLAISLAAVVIAVWRLTQDFQVGPLGQAAQALFKPGMDTSMIDIYEEMAEGYSIDLVAIASFWALFNASRATYFITKAIRNARRSHTFFRFRIPLPVALPEYGGALARTDQIAENRARISLPAHLSHAVRAGNLSLRIFLPDGPLAVQMAVTNRGPGWFEGDLMWADRAGRDRLASALYSVNWHREYQVNVAYFLTPSDALLALFGQRLRRPPAARSWQPLLLQPGEGGPDGAMPAIALNPALTGLETSIISFCPLVPGRAYAALSIDDQGERPARFEVLEESPISALPNKGLDGSVYRRYKVIFLAETGSAPDACEKEQVYG